MDAALEAICISFQGWVLVLKAYMNLRPTLVIFVRFSIFIVSVMALAPCLQAGEPVTPRMAVGLNYPGVSGRYFMNEAYAVEVKGQFEKDIILGGLRGYRYFRSIAGVKPFAGIELDYISFKGAASKGPGFAAELFFGGEVFFMKNLSAQLDFGPAYVQLTDDASSASVGGLEYVVNVGVNWYFAGK